MVTVLIRNKISLLSGAKQVQQHNIQAIMTFFFNKYLKKKVSLVSYQD